MSTIKADTIVASDGTSPVTLTKQSAAKAWVNFDGTAATLSARDSFNVASFTDHSAGIYTTSWTNSMNNASYSSVVTSNINQAYGGQDSIDTVATGSLKTKTYYGASYAGTDSSIICHSSFGDLA